MNDNYGQRPDGRNFRCGPGAAALLALLLALSPARATDINVSTPTEVTLAAAAARPGDILVMRDGVWNNADLLFAANGSNGAPVTLRAQTLGGVHLTGASRLRMAGRFLVVDGLVFTNGYRTSGEIISFQDTTFSIANFSRITNCSVINFNPPDLNSDTKWVTMYGFSNRVENCFFTGKINLGSTIVVAVDTAPDRPNYHQIRGNYFGFRPPLGQNGGETIRVGESAVSLNNSRTTVEQNYFEQCNGDAEIISSKSCENIYRNNTFVDCEGAFSLRHGNRCVVEGNYFFGHNKPLTGGVRISGEDHQVYNNYFHELAGTSSRAPLAIMQGLVNSPPNGYLQVFRASVTFNTFVNCTNTFHIGLVGTLGGTTDTTTLPPVDCIIANNLAYTPAGKIIDQRIIPENMTWQGNIFFGTSLGVTNPGGITLTNPLLAPGAGGLYRPDPGSPALGAALGNYPYVTLDMDGQARPALKDVGADQASAAPITRPPLRAVDVGPLWMRAPGTVMSWASPADITYGTTLGPAQLNAAANVPGAFVYTPPAGTLLRAGTGQTLRVVFTPVNLATYSAATQTVTINVLQASPTLTWLHPANLTYGTMLGSNQLNAASSLPGSFTYTPSAGTVLNVGVNQPLLATFTPADSTNYAAVTRTNFITVVQGIPLLVWSNPPAIESGTTLGSAQLNATSSVPGTYTYTPPAGTVLSPGSGLPLTVDFTPNDPANYVSVARTVFINVTIGGRLLPALQWNNPADITFGTALSSTQLNATATIPGTFTYTPPAGTVLSVGNDQPLTVNFFPSNTATYTNATRTVLLKVATPISRSRVRVAYLIPTNRTAQASAVANLRESILTYQAWFREQMTQSGLGPKSFAFETEPGDDATPLIHVAKLTVTDAFLRGDLYGGRVTNAARAAGLTVGNRAEVWWLIPETHVENPDGTISGSFDLSSSFGGSADDPGWAIMGSETLALCTRAHLTNDSFYVGQIIPGIGPYPLQPGVSFAWFEGSTISSLASSTLGAGLRELAEALGLDPDYRNDENFDGNLTGFGFRGLRGALLPKRYPYNYTRLPYGAALSLNTSRYFNPGRPITDLVKPTLTFASGGTINPVRGQLPITFTAADSGGLHAAFLCWDNGEESILVGELPLDGATSATRTFETPYYDLGRTNLYTVSALDLQGNRRRATVAVLPGPTVNRAPQPWLVARPSTAGPGEDIILDATRSFDPDQNAQLLEVEWDFDGDGGFDTELGTALLATNNYLTLGVRLVRFRATDPAGAESISAPVAISIVPCVATVSPIARMHGYAATGGSIGVTTSTKCMWTATTTNSWITITNGTTGPGPGRASYALTENPGMQERVGAVQIGDAFFVIRQSPYFCTYSLSPTNRFSGFGVSASNSIKVTTRDGCSWSVQNTNSWVSLIFGAGGGTSTGVVAYALAENRTNAPRFGFITVAEQTFAITQWGTNCSYILSATSRAHTAISETGTVTVTTASGCPWNVINTNPWVTITSLPATAGSGTLGYRVDANANFVPRSGTLEIAGSIFTLTQAACSLDLSPATRTHGSSLELGTVTVNTAPGCGWTVVNTNSWVTIIGGASGLGSGSFTYSVASNPLGSPRTATLQIGARTFTITQLGVFCAYQLTINGLTAEQILGEGTELEAFHGEGAEVGVVEVATGLGCPWTVDNPIPWVSIIAGANGSGNATMVYSVQANPGNPRAGFMTIAGQSFQVNQLGGLRRVNAGDITINGGGTNWIPVILNSHGTENRFSFSLCFDTNLLTYAAARIGAGAFGGSLIVDASQKAQGQTGFTVAMPPGWSLPAGNQVVAEVSLRAAPVGGRPATTVSFCDAPVARSVVDVLAQPVPVEYQNAIVRIYGDCSLGESLDAPQFTWNSLAGGAWACQTNVTHDGEDAAASPILPDSGDSYFETTLAGPGALTFWWKISSEPGSDRLRFYLDGSSQLTISGEVDWQRVSFVVAAGSHVLRWRYNKNSSLAAGQDQGWVDDIEFTPTPPVITAQPTSRAVDLGSAMSLGVTAGGAPPVSYQWLFNGSPLVDGGAVRGTTTPTLTISNIQFIHAGTYSVRVGGPAGSTDSVNAVISVTPVITIPESVDAPALVFTPGGNLPWRGQAEVTHDGQDAAQSGPITDSQTSSFLTTFTGPGTLTFWWKASSQAGSDRLRLYLNGSSVTEISGEVDWVQNTQVLGSGLQTLEWRYTKNSSTSAGLDRGWVDEISFIPTPVSITSQPGDQGVDSGSTVTLNVAATGAPPLTYQWRFSGANVFNGPGIAGATSASLILSNIQIAQSGDYSVVVANGAGSVLSSNAVVSVTPVLPLAEALDATEFTWTTTGTPVWTGQAGVTHDGADAARSGAIPDSGDTRFSTTVVGPGSVSFWWKVSSEAGSDRLRFYLAGSSVAEISGEVDWEWRSFTFGSGSQVLQWRYSKNSSVSVGLDRAWVDQVVIITNNARVAPFIAIQPVGQTVVGGSAASLRVSASGTTPLSYQWQLNGTNLSNSGGFSGVTTTNLAIASAQAAHAGSYTLVITNIAGSVVSDPAVLSVITAPVITNQPSGQQAVAGATVNLTVGAVGAGTLSYQWRFNGTNLANGGVFGGTATATLKITGAQAAQNGVYSVVVTNTAGSVVSADATLVVSTPPSISLHPTNQTWVVGSPVSFTAGAGGSAPLNFQWRLNGANLVDGPGVTGAASSSLVISNVQAAQAGVTPSSSRTRSGRWRAQTRC